MVSNDPSTEIRTIRARLDELDAERALLAARLAALMTASETAGPVPIVEQMSASEKVALFQRRFRGRSDVFALRWESRKSGRSGYSPACGNEWIRGVCEKPQVKCSDCRHQAFIPLTDTVVVDHFKVVDRSGRVAGDFTVGIYPVLADSTCWFLAADFDGAEWHHDARAYLEACRALGIDGALERSRSGNGAHVWVFFDEPVAAHLARRLGDLLLTDAMDRRPEIGFSSYDRLFPSQDFVTPGGFGNLIALPFQSRPREHGNSLFIDENLNPLEDQWAFLAAMRPMSREEVERLVDTAAPRGRIGGVRMPVDDENADQPWVAPPSRSIGVTPITEPLPTAVDVVLADQVYVERAELPPTMVARIVRLAAFQNPEFYRAQALRLSTFDKPRIISCAELHPRHIALPRGCLDDVLALFDEHGITSKLRDLRESGVPLLYRFVGRLRDEQLAALQSMAPHDFGVLSATTGFGKTVVAAALIAQRRCSTLVLVHRRELLAQWVESLRTFLAIDPGDIGVIGGGRRKPTGKIDVAVVQSLVRRGEVSDLIEGYGHLVIDECHHVSATSIELLARRSKARYVVGLSATVARKDGHHPIIFMQCGPIRHTVDARSQARKRGFRHRVEVRETSFMLPVQPGSTRSSMPAIYAALAGDDTRSAAIVRDVLAALDDGRFPIVMTERREHLEKLSILLAASGVDAIVLHGGVTPRERRAAIDRLREPPTAPRLVLATGRYLGEGFDDARADTLFLTMPISWKGTLAQYVGRLHREHGAKTEVIVYDYVDSHVPTLLKMAVKRMRGYRSLGYEMSDATEDASDGA